MEIKTHLSEYNNFMHVAHEKQWAESKITRESTVMKNYNFMNFQHNNLPGCQEDGLGMVDLSLGVSDKRRLWVERI